jgi:rRNA-processing protein FCF1
MVRIVLVDSNFLLLPAQGKLDIYSELDRILPEKANIVVYQALFKELERKLRDIPPQNKIHREIRLAHQLLESHGISITAGEPLTGQDVDDFLIDQAKNLQQQGNFVYIATVDRQLRKKCQINGFSVIYARNTRKLEIE